MKILVLGGTIFVGRHIVEAALGRGHEVTLFNRGTRPSVFPNVDTLIGDRDGDLTALEGKQWDAVIDTSGYVPRVVRDSAELLRDSVGHYTFVSSISVYDDRTTPYLDEDASVATLKRDTEEVTSETYGALKALCEDVVNEVYGDAALNVRPGIVVGPYDPTDRFTYWVRRVAEGGEVLAPGGPEKVVQYIDARDLGAWVVTNVEARTAGTYNTVTTPDTVSFGDVVRHAREASGSDAEVTWVSEDFLLEQGVKPFADLPLWLPGERANFFRVSNERARALGLTPRPVRDTVADTYSWDAKRDEPLTAGIDRDREQALLSKWHHQSRGRQS
ncbi:MAG: NAD-dependent epimerase/dehydratase family protein [Trueperaceae bacterium]|nr:NAD-dependent epimerase/dehydratase family protein [Trueperaceae bacterium]